MTDALTQVLEAAAGVGLVLLVAGVAFIATDRVERRSTKREGKRS